MPIAVQLDKKLKAFLNSIPLLLDLKNKALRERFVLIYLHHYIQKYLMLELSVSITGVMPCSGAWNFISS